MYTIKTLNAISPVGLAKLPANQFEIDNEAAEAGFVNLKGHRLVGGMRASIYNAMPAEGVDKLVDFMEKFRKENA